MKFSTKAIHAGNEPNLKAGGSGDVVIPIHLSTTFARKKVSRPTGGYEYSRSGNPTRNALEENLAALEGGTAAFAFSSGLAAIANILLLLKRGDHLISIDDVYGGTRRLFKQVFEKFDLEFSFVNFVTGKDLQRHIQKNTKLIWIESPTNPLLKIVDIASVCGMAKSKKILTVVDNTFASPYFQKPLLCCKYSSQANLHLRAKSFFYTPEFRGFRGFFPSQTCSSDSPEFLYKLFLSLTLLLLPTNIQQ